MANDELALPGEIVCFPIELCTEHLDGYADALGLTDRSAALDALAHAIVSGPCRPELSSAALIVRHQPYPALAVVGRLGRTMQANLAAQSFRLQGGRYATLRYVSYAQAEEDCEQLATRLIDHFGSEECRRLNYVGIPRGGLIVLGMLAYALSLERRRISELPTDGAPLVVVDDCSLTGARFGRFLAGLPHDKVVFTHLYSHPELRHVIERSESRVLACLSAHDLHDFDAADDQGAHGDRKAQWAEHLDEYSYVFRRTEQLGFAWGEPDHMIWNSVSEQMDAGWGLLPPSHCLKRRTPASDAAMSVQVQPEGIGPLAPSADVMYGEFEGQVVLGHLVSRQTLGLNAVASDIWQAIVRYGSVDEALVALRGQYDVGETRLRLDIATFVDDLLSQSLLSSTDAANEAKV